MKPSARTLLVTLLLALAVLGGQEVYQLARVYYSDMSDLDAIAGVGIPLDHVRMKRGVFVEVVATKEQIARLQQIGMQFDILQDDLAKFFKSRFERGRRMDRGFELGSMGGNYTYDELGAELDSIHNLYPDLVSEKTSIGLSLEKRDIWAVKLSDNVDVDENENMGGDFEPLVLYTGLTHAREPLGMMNLVYFMYYLCENYSTDEEITYIVNNRELWFVPIVNPDGYVYNETIEPDGGGMHRKNRRNSGCIDETSRGVDLNRNYSFNWGPDYPGSSSDSCLDIFQGDSAFSEPETSVLRDFMLSKNFKNALHYHSYSNLLIHSFGTGEYPPEPDLTMLRLYGKEMTKFNYYRVGTAPETVGYPVNGDAVDYSYGTLGLVSYTPEVGTYSDNFWPPTHRIIPLCEENLWPNLVFAGIAGTLLEIDSVTTDSEYANPGDTAAFNILVKNIGLRSSLGSVTATLTPLTSAMDFEPVQMNVGMIDRWESVYMPATVAVVIDSATRGGCPAGLRIHMDDSGYEAFVDTFAFIIGIPSFLLVDDGETDMGKWQTTSWGISTDAHEGIQSITDSPYGNYGHDANDTLALNDPIDLSESSHSMLRFWARWDIEPVWDFVQVQASLGGLHWISLWGDHTRGGSGNGVQPRGLPGYDGTQPDWIQETVDLSGFDGEPEVDLRFQIRSDSWVEGDGFYFDNLEILSYPASDIAQGDVTKDCEIDVADVLQVVDMIVSSDIPSALEHQLADMNNDLTVDVFDIVLLVDLVLGR